MLILYCAFRALRWHVGRLFRADLGFMDMEMNGNLRVDAKGKRDVFAGMI